MRVGVLVGEAICVAVAVLVGVPVAMAACIDGGVWDADILAVEVWLGIVV